MSLKSVPATPAQRQANPASACYPLHQSQLLSDAKAKGPLSLNFQAVELLEALVRRPEVTFTEVGFLRSSMQKAGVDSRIVNVVKHCIEPVLFDIAWEKEQRLLKNEAWSNDETAEAIRLFHLITNNITDRLVGVASTSNLITEIRRCAKHLDQCLTRPAAASLDGSRTPFGDPFRVAINNLLFLSGK